MPGPIKRPLRDAVTTLNTELRRGRQKVCLTELLRHDRTGRRVRVEVEVDTSYDFQSSATIDTLDPETLKWSNLASVHYSNMKSRLGPTPHPDNFAADREALLGLFLKLID